MGVHGGIFLLRNSDSLFLKAVCLEGSRVSCVFAGFPSMFAGLYLVWITLFHLYRRVGRVCRG